MDEMQVYIANLGKYNEGELVGAWFTPPINYDELAERIGLNDEYEEYAIHDFELPFEIEEYTSIEEINRLCGLAEGLEETSVGKAVYEIQGAFFSSFEEMMDNVDEIYCYEQCSDMSDVAYHFVEEGLLGEIPEAVLPFFDYEEYGKALEMEGRFVVTSHGVFEYRG